MKSYALEGGIKAWATAGEQYVKAMVEYDATVWTPQVIEPEVA